MKFTTFRKRIKGYELGLWKRADVNSEVYRQRYHSDEPIDSVNVYINFKDKTMMINITKEELSDAGLVWREN